MCDNVTNEYLEIESKECGSGSSGVCGCIDNEHANNMPRYQSMVAKARDDKKGESTQASTLNGHVLHKAGMFENNNI